MDYEELISQDNNAFAEAVRHIETIIKLVKENPVLKHFCEYDLQHHIGKENDKIETKFIEYQHTENAINRFFIYDREHPVDRVNINEFNRQTDSNLEEVKIIYGPAADEYTRSHHALAMAVADKIYFRNGAYKPETEEGQKLLAHELTHVKQFKEKGLTDRKTKEEKEIEAEYYEKQKEYNPDEKLNYKIGNTEYSFTRAEWKQIKAAVKKDLCEWIDTKEHSLTDKEYLDLLCKFEKWEKQGNNIWQN